MPNILFLIFIIIPPILALFNISLSYTESNSNGLLLYYLSNSAIFTIATTILSVILGTLSAYFVTFFNLRFRLIIQLVLIFPIAMPSYVSALSYSYLLEFAGPVQTFLRDNFHINIAPYFNIRSMGGLIFIMSMSSFPYVYIVSINAMLKIKHLVQIAKTFNKDFKYILFHIVIPMCKKQIIAGGLLVFMDSLSDFATSQMLAVDTINNAIYKAWFLNHNPPYAARISLFILLISLFVIFLRKKYIKNHRVDMIKSQDIYHNITKKKSFYIYCFSVIILLFSFIIPLIPLINWSFVKSAVTIDIFSIIKNTLYLSTISSIIITIISFILVVKQSNNYSFLSQIGFSFPNSIVSMGLIGFFTFLSRYIPEFPLIGTISGVIYAYIFSFTALSFNTINGEFKKFPRYVSKIMRSFNRNTIWDKIIIYLPILKSGFVLSILLSFIEISKEISMILILRPFNFNTIAIKTFDLFMDERYEDAAKPALILVIISMILVVILSKSIYKKQKYDNIIQ